MMIQTVQFKFGPQPGVPGLSFAPGAMTVFVGPNNSGKSLLIRELNAWLTTGPEERRPPIISSHVEIRHVQDADYRLAACSVVKSDMHRSGLREETYVHYSAQFSARVQQLMSYKTHSWIDAAWAVTATCSLLLGGDKRLQLTEQQDMSDLQLEPTNHLAALMQSPDRRRAARSVIHEAFKRYFVLDPTNGGKIRIRLSDREPLTGSSLWNDPIGESNHLTGHEQTYWNR